MAAMAVMVVTAESGVRFVAKSATPAMGRAVAMRAAIESDAMDAMDVMDVTTERSETDMIVTIEVVLR